MVAVVWDGLWAVGGTRKLTLTRWLPPDGSLHFKPHLISYLIASVRVDLAPLAGLLTTYLMIIGGGWITIPGGWTTTPGS